MTQKQVRKRKRRTKREYFTKVHEEAILEYCSTEDLARKNELYDLLVKIKSKNNQFSYIKKDFPKKEIC